MKYAFMSFSMPEATFAELLETAGHFGYAGIEPRLDAKHGHDVEVAADHGVRRAFAAQAEAAGVAICCLATSCRFADPATAPDAVAHCHDVIDLAGDVEAPCIRVFGGAFPDSLDREQAIAQVADSLASLADHAASRNVTLCMETHDSWCDPAHVAAIMTRVNHPAIAVNWDIMHPVRAAKVPMQQAYETLKPWIRHVHVHDGAEVDGKLEFRHIGEGAIDHGLALRCLRDLGYQGYLSGEWINWTPWKTHLPAELAALKSLEP